MYFSRAILSLVLGALAPLPALADYTFFNVTAPTTGTTWVNGAANPVTWTKGLLDDLVSVDVELARLSQDGLILVALNVPAKAGKLNLFLQDVPSASDYYLLFVNATHGGMHGISQQFSIADSSSTASAASGASTSPVKGGATVTVSGGPNPTAQFATTFPAIAQPNAATRRAEGAHAALVGVMGAAAAVVLSAAWVGL